MKKLLILLAAFIMVAPIMGCNKEPEDTGKVTMPDGSTPDASKPGGNEEAGGSATATPL